MGCTTGPILKTGWATGPVPLRGQPTDAGVAALGREAPLQGSSREGHPLPRMPFCANETAPILKTGWATGPVPLRPQASGTSPEFR